MASNDLLNILVSIDFPTKYWALCDRYPLVPYSAYKGTKQEILDAFHEIGACPRYDGRDRSYSVEAEAIGDTHWSAVFQTKRSGLEMLICGATPEGVVGSNFAVLAYQAKQLSDPSFVRNPFSSPPPYPRPSLASRESLSDLLENFIAIVREVKTAVRLAANAQ